MFLNPGKSVAQNQASQFLNGTSGSETGRVARVRFSGNSNVRNSTLYSIVRTQSNRELLSIPGVTLWYWLNQINDNWGESASRLDRQIVGTDMDRIKAYYRSIGYLDTAIDTIIVDYGKGKYEISFLITEGRASRIRSIAYSGFPDFQDERLLERFYRRSELAGAAIDDTTFEVNKQYSVELLGRERTNIISLLKNNGYASVIGDSVIAIVERTDENPYQMDVRFIINPGITYKFGDLSIILDGASSEETSVTYDTLGPPITIDPAKIFVQKEESARTRLSLIQNTLLFKPGDTYDHELYLQTIRRFQNLGMLNVRQFGLSLDGSLPDYSKPVLPVRIDMQTIPRQSIRFDIFGMQRLGLGAGTGVRYINNNLWGSAEMLTLGVKGSFENAPNVSAGFLRSFEGTVEYSLPRLTFPFKRLSERGALINSRTRYQLSYAEINQLNFNVNANLRFNLKYEVAHTPTATSVLDLIEFDWFDASPTNRFRERIENEIADPFQRERILNDFSQQFSSILRYTLRHSTTNVIKRNSGYYNEVSVEFGGSIPYLIERYLVRPNEPLQSTIPSLTLADSTLSYSRFVKAYIDHRDYTSFGDNTVVAWRTFAGIAYAYGQNTQVPLNRRFFAGGSNDIRGWPPLRLGPGSINVGQVTVNGADIKLATFLETRQVLFRNFLSTNWVFALFADAGNIWNGPRSEFQDGKFKIDSFYKEIAIGAGYGLRLDWEYVIFRIDAGYRVYDPAFEDGTRRGWFNSPNPYIHFGIGHSF